MTEETTKTNKDTETKSSETKATKGVAVGVKGDEKTRSTSSVRAAVPRKAKFEPRRGPRARFERPKPEFEQKIIKIRRVTRVVAGGRRFSFSVVMVIGDKKGAVGVGIGKASDTALAIGKALKDAKKNLRKISTTKTMSIPQDVRAKLCSSKVILMPNKGKGIVAGSSVRDVLNLAGLKDVSAKILSGSKNKLNNARAAMKALSTLTYNLPASPKMSQGGQEQKEKKSPDPALRDRGSSISQPNQKDLGEIGKKSL